MTVSRQELDFLIALLSNQDFAKTMAETGMSAYDVARLLGTMMEQAHHVDQVIRLECQEASDARIAREKNLRLNSAEHINYMFNSKYPSGKKKKEQRQKKENEKQQKKQG